MAKRGGGPKPFRPTVTRYETADGKRCKKGDPGARKLTTKTATFYADIWSNGRYERTSLKTDDESVAWRRLKDILRQRREEELGIRDPADALAQQDIQEHINDWMRVIEARGSSVKHSGQRRRAVEELTRLAGWKRITDITADSCELALARLLAPDEEHPKGRSPQTRNHYLSAARQFTRWAATRGKRLKADPLAGVLPISVEHDRRHARRVPTDKEIETLFAYLDGESDRGVPPAIHGLSGPHRALAYKVAMATGFRISEVRSLTRDAFDLDAARVTLRAGHDKRRRQAIQDLPAWLVAELRAWFEAGGTCWGAMPGHFPGGLLKADLEAAGIPRAVRGGGGDLEYFDAHSLRHWYCTRVASADGVSIKTMMTLCRHSTADLTLKVYAHAQAEDLRAAVGQIPDPSPKKSRRSAGQENRSEKKG